MDFNNLLFIYGSMKSGHSNHKRLLRHRAKFISEISTVDGFNLIYYTGPNFGIACLIKSLTGTVKGELYEISDIQPINQFEGVPYVYSLSELGLWDGTREIQAFGYLYSSPEDFNNHNSILIPEGNYRESIDYRQLLKMKNTPY